MLDKFFWSRPHSFFIQSFEKIEQKKRASNEAPFLLLSLYNFDMS